VIAVALAGIAFWQRGLAVQSEQRAIAGEEQARRNEARANEERDQALLTQSRFLADLANQRIAAGDASAGVLLALEALPDAEGAERPYAPEPEQALYAAFQKMHDTSQVQTSTRRPACSTIFAVSLPGAISATTMWAPS
jgi:hypothetical protein